MGEIGFEMVRGAAPAINGLRVRRYGRDMLFAMGPASEREKTSSRRHEHGPSALMFALEKAAHRRQRMRRKKLRGYA